MKYVHLHCSVLYLIITKNIINYNLTKLFCFYTVLYCILQFLITNNNGKGVANKEVNTPENRRVRVQTRRKFCTRKILFFWCHRVSPGVRHTYKHMFLLSSTTTNKMLCHEVN